MAMSFTRPDPSSPASVADAGFNTSRRGFDQAEVRDFLRMIAAELGRLQERERFLERELRTAQSNPDLSTAQLDDAALTRLLGEETARVLTTARESAAEIRQKAEQAAAQLLSEASDEAARMREEAEVEASRRRTDAASDAEAELSMAKQQGREMVNEARAYRERVLSELARRRELAREQIEQLLHGRDRLLQSFERARLVAVDVVAELQPLGEPDEYVNLAPTTGPVPVMVPNSPRPPAAHPGAAPTEMPDVDAGATGTILDVGAPDGDADAQPDRATESSRTGDEAADERSNEGGAEQIDVEETTEPTAEVTDEMTAEGTEVSVDAEDDAEVTHEARERDDVVVDLFARLRAEAVTIEPGTSATDEAEQAVHAGADTDVEHETAADEGDDAVATPFESRDADLTPIIVVSARKLKRALADEQNEVLEALRGTGAVDGIDALLPPAAEHVGRYAGAIADELRSAADAGAALVGRSKPLVAADAAAAVSAADDVLAEWLVEPLRERLARCVSDGDGDRADISKRVRAVYREWKTQHIDEQLDDIVRMAHGSGVLAGIAPGTGVVWACDDSHQGCADCDDNSLAGTIPAGEAFPTGHTFAPAHIGCRCLLLPAGR
jgi:DivIVA domain-containing protein